LLCLLLSSLQGFAQNLTITGKVTSSRGEILPGVNVLLQGTNEGTITNADGVYQLSAKDGTLVFSFIGFKTIEVPINGRTEVNVQMEEDVRMLEQVVVVGYGSQKKKDLTTAVVTVSENDIRIVRSYRLPKGCRGGGRGTSNPGIRGSRVGILQSGFVVPLPLQPAMIPLCGRRHSDDGYPWSQLPAIFHR